VLALGVKWRSGRVGRNRALRILGKAVEVALGGLLEAIVYGIVAGGIAAVGLLIVGGSQQTVLLAALITLAAVTAISLLFDGLVGAIAATSEGKADQEEDAAENQDTADA
jgi:hypothetical protein